MRKYRTHKEVLAEFMKDPEFRKGYEALRPKYEAISAVIRERIKNGLTQKELAEKIKTKQSNISRFESGRVIPSLNFLNKIAQAFNKRLEIRFRPAT
jgi:ribosome-binding protein aMBF1 (putative translation factor)